MEVSHSQNFSEKTQNGCIKPVRKLCIAGFINTRPYPPFIKMWLKEHPEEKRKMELSRKEWEAKRDKQFRIVYGIAKKHHIYMEWCGKETSSCGDDWVIKKNGEEIGYLRVEDTLPL